MTQLTTNDVIITIPGADFTIYIAMISDSQFEIKINATSPIESGTQASISFSRAVRGQY